MLAASAGWDALAAELLSTAAAYASTVDALTVGPWTGPSSIAMAAAAAPYVAWINATGAQAEQAATQAKLAAGAYETAFADETPELAAPVYRIPFPQDKLEFIRWWIRGIVLTPLEDGVSAQVVRYEV